MRTNGKLVKNADLAVRTPGPAAWASHATLHF